MIYICGPMSAYPEDLNEPRFEEMRKKLKKELCKLCVFIPHDFIPFDTPYDTALIRSVSMMISADCVFFLSGWEKSNGASIENAIAKMLKMTIMYEIEGGTDGVFRVSENEKNS